MIFYSLFFLFLSCSSHEFHANSEDHFYDLINQSAAKWELNIELKKQKKIENNLILISKNLACQEPELIENQEFCQEELKKIKNYYSEIMAFCLTETNSYGIIKKSYVVINDNFFYSLYWNNQTKINTIAHEIGHCFGLKHFDNKENIMYPFRQDGFQNLEPQRTILKNLYFRKIEPSEKEQKDFFQNYKQYFLRYEKIPSFYVKF